MKKKYVLVLLVIGVAVFFIPRWEVKLQPTRIHIVDPVRHYFPIVQGDELGITVEVKNDGKEDLSITDIQPSNFSIARVGSMPGVIPAGKSELIQFVFNSDKNIGYTKHVIRFFGNIENGGVDSLVFDVHIVRPTLDGSDYEEIYYQKKQSEVEELVDGERGQKSYWVDGDPDIDSSYIHSYNNDMYVDW